MRALTMEYRKRVGATLLGTILFGGAAFIAGCGSDGEVGLAPIVKPTPPGPPTLTPVRTSTPSITPTPTVTATATSTHTRTPRATATITETGTRTSTPTITQTPTISGTPTSTGTVTKTRTVTNTPTSSPTPRPTPGPGNVRVDVGSGTGQDGSHVEIAVTLEAGDREVARIAHDIVYDPTLVEIVSPASDCQINPAIGAAADGCLERPQVGPCKSLLRNLGTCPTSGCPAGFEGRKRLRIDIDSTQNSNLIPSGVLYSCNFRLAEGVNAATVLLNLNVRSFSAGGATLPSAGSDGVITVELRPTPTPTLAPVGDCCVDRSGVGAVGCEDSVCESCVCNTVEIGGYCCTDLWDALCAEIGAFECYDVCRCE